MSFMSDSPSPGHPTEVLPAIERIVIGSWLDRCVTVDRLVTVKQSFQNALAVSQTRKKLGQLVNAGRWELATHGRQVATDVRIDNRAFRLRHHCRRCSYRVRGHL